LLYFLLRWSTASYTIPLVINSKAYWISFCFYVLFIFFWNIFFGSIASDSICDPLLRFGDSDKLIVYPLSEVDNSDVTFLVPREKHPKMNGICIADTKYTIRGQQQVTVAIIACFLAFCTCIVTKLYLFVELAVAGAFLLNMFVIVSFSLALQIVFNDDSWDWRVFLSIFFSFIVSEFSMVSVLYRDDTHRKTSWVFCMIWMYAQILDSIENAFLSIFASKTDVKVYF
jgi:hypothetical protein